MNKKGFYLAVVFLCGLAAAPLSFADHHEHDRHHDAHHDTQQKSVENLSTALRALLQKEMMALQTGMVSAIPALISGNLGEVEKIAQNMKDSYILKQSITKEQVEELHSSLPAGFLKMDKEFHYYAGMLAHVANRKKLELVNFYFSKLTESCVSCHSEYAPHKFPGLSMKGSSEKHDH